MFKPCQPLTNKKILNLPDIDKFSKTNCEFCKHNKSFIHSIINKNPIINNHNEKIMHSTKIINDNKLHDKSVKDNKSVKHN